MTEIEQVKDADDLDIQRHRSRLGLIWAVLVFQAKLIVDGLRDLVLVPVSLIAALLGLLAGGDEPDRYFLKILRLGRRSEIWINLFGHRKHAATSDSILEPMKQKFMDESEQQVWARNAGHQFNRTLDIINERVVTAASTREDKSREDQ